MNPLFWTALFSAALPAFWWIFLWYRKDSIEPEPKRMVALAFVFGILAALPFFGVRFLFGGFSGGLFLLIILAAFEEIAKAIMVLWLGKILHIHFTQIVDGIVYSVAVGLGFAFAENLWYFWTTFDGIGISSESLWIFVFRSMGTMLAHALFSGIFGFLWAYAIFSQQITPHHRLSLTTLWKSFFRTIRFHILFSHIFSSHPSLHGHEKAELVREALLLAIVLHVLFNVAVSFSLFGHSLTPLVIPILAGLFFFLSEQFLQKKNIDIRRPL